MTFEDLSPAQQAQTAAVERDGQTYGAAVLLLNLASRQVVHVNTVAHGMARSLLLPATVEAWAAAASLPDLSARVDTTLEALRLLANSEVPPEEAPVLTLRARPNRDPETWQVVALPLTGADALQGHALLILLPERLPSHGPGAAGVVRERALSATTLSFTIADARQPDAPLTWVNPAFCLTTGYEPGEVLGRNCRFLQGPDTDAASVARIRKGLAVGDEVTCVLLNYRKDGTPFWNELTITPVLDASGEVTHFVGVQADVTDRVEREQQVQKLLDAEQAARQKAEVLSERLALMAHVSVELSETLDFRDGLDRLTAAVVPSLADWAIVSVVDHGALNQVTARHRDGLHEQLRRWAELQPATITENSATMQALRSRRPVLQQVTPAAAGGSGALAGEHVRETVEILERLGLAEALVVPLIARGEVVGTLALLRSSPGWPFHQADVDTANDLARTAALALDNARVFQRAHETALTLQRSMLPELPSISGLSLAATYAPSDATAQIGGDWWDAFSLNAEPGEPIALAIGDVMGHDLAAATAMGQLRSVLRTSAWVGDDPATVLSRMDRLVQTFDMAQMATCIYARLEPADPPDGRRRHARLHWSNAGHLPPIVKTPDGQVVLLDDHIGVPIGVGCDERRPSSVISVPTGSTVLLYTDGLIETRHGDIDADLRRLADLIERHDDRQGPNDLISRLVEECDPTSRDDIAVLAARVE